MKIIYAGTPDFAATALQALINSEHEIIAVYTQPDRPSGRGRKVTYNPVKQCALEHNIPVLQPDSLKTLESQEMLSSLGADIMVVAAYGLILPQEVLDIPRYGCLNIHASLLPQWRGAAPIQRAIQAGDEISGITIMQMAAGLDTGDILYKTQCAIKAHDTAGSLHDKLAIQGKEAILHVLQLVRENQLRPITQDNSLASYAHKLHKSEGLIDWSLSASIIDQKIRSFNPWPSAYTLWNGKTIKCLFSSVSADTNHHTPPGKVIAESSTGIDVATGQGILTLKCLQLPSKKAVDVKDFLNAHSLLGEQLGQ